MKRKVQAQRKFAQGAYIPPSSNSNPPPDRRAGADPQPLEQKNVFYNKMSADMLLDIISFQNLHQRPEPVVVLKRLSKGHEKPEPPPAALDNDSNREVARRPAPPRRNTMLLRSRNRRTFKTRKIAQKAKKRVRRRIIKKVIPPPTKTLLRKRKIPMLTDGYDLEDDKPLKFFASSSGSLRGDPSKRRRLRMGTEAKVVKHKSSKVVVKELRSVAALKKNPIRVAVKRTLRSPPVSKPTLRSSEVKRSPEKTKHNEKRQSVESKETRVSRSVTPPLQKSPIVEPQTKRSSVSATSQQSPSTANSINLPFPTNAVNGTYPSKGISVEGWLDSASLSTPDKEARSFKMPLRPNRRRDDIRVVKKLARVEPTKVKKKVIAKKVSSKSSSEVHDLPVDITEKVIKKPAKEPLSKSVKEAPFKSVKEPPKSVKEPPKSVKEHPKLVKEPPKSVKEPPKSMKEPLSTADLFQPLKKEKVLEKPMNRRHSEPKSDKKSTQNAAIEGWLQNSISSSKVSDMFKSPILPAKRAVPGLKPPEDALDLGLRSRSVDSICSSERFRSVKDIVNAGEHELESRCKQRNCQACCRVNKLRQLKNMVQKSTNKRDDVYEFNDDTSVCSMGIYRGLRVPPRDLPSTSAPTLSSLVDAPEDQPVYLDILPNGTHIIQITDLNKKNKIMRASVVPKSEADIRNEFSLIEHENLLDQLLEIKLFNLQKNARTEDKSLNEKSKGSVYSKPSDVIVIPDESGTESDDADITLGSIRTRRRTESINVQKETQANQTSQQSDRVNAVPKKSAKPHVPKKATESTSAPKNNEQNGSLTDNVSFPKELDTARLVDAPVFYPTEAEFTDPIAYFEKISATAAKFGLCKVVAPASFRPTCSVSDEIRFNVSNQYVARLFRRWGAAARETCAIRAYLAAHSVTLTRAPLYEGIEVNLPKLYHIVQRNGGLKNVIEKKRWGRVAEEMHYTRAPNAEKRLDQLYVKYLLPYDTLSTKERQEMMAAVERCWDKKNRKMLERALNPLHRQKRLLGESDSSDDAEEEDDMAWALAEAEDCVVSGRSMTLATFKKVASSAMETLFPHSGQPAPDAVEQEYWRLVLRGHDHVCVNAAAIDTGDVGHGFTKNKADPYGRHPWNLKMLSQNEGNVLRSMGPVLGVTVPTLHVGMVLATSCWHRDPHALPWGEYMHSGPPTIWYGIPDEQSANFRKAVETLCPTSCQNKSIWLPSDITMIPPDLLREHNVSLCRVVQNPGEYIFVFPKAYSCSICTGYTQSESVYFATASWLDTVTQVFQEVKESCEPTMFSLEQVVVGIARDPRVSASVLGAALPVLRTLIQEELHHRHELKAAGLHCTTAQSNKIRQPKKRPAGAWNVREQDECDICRSTLYLSKVVGLTGKRSAVCVQHALRLLRAGQSAAGGALVAHVSPHELQEALTAAERRLDAAVSRAPRRTTTTDNKSD